MSAFVVSPTHIDVLLSVALHGPTDGGDQLDWSPPYLEEASARLSPRTASVLGAGLLAENIASVAHRYPDCARAELPGPAPMPSPEQYEFTDFGACLSIAEACSAIDCFEYQSCEHQEWEASASHSFCARLRASLTAALPGAADAPWEWSPETLAHRGHIPLGLNALDPERTRDVR
jgi:hypothetical protein